MNVPPGSLLVWLREAGLKFASCDPVTATIKNEKGKASAVPMECEVDLAGWSGAAGPSRGLNGPALYRSAGSAAPPKILYPSPQGLYLQGSSVLSREFRSMVERHGLLVLKGKVQTEAGL